MLKRGLKIHLEPRIWHFRVEKYPFRLNFNVFYFLLHSSNPATKETSAVGGGDKSWKWIVLLLSHKKGTFSLSYHDCHVRKLFFYPFRLFTVFCVCACGCGMRHRNRNGIEEPKSISHILNLIKCTCISVLDCISCQVVPFFNPYSNSRDIHDIKERDVNS